MLHVWDPAVRGQKISTAPLGAELVQIISSDHFKVVHPVAAWIQIPPAGQ